MKTRTEASQQLGPKRTRDHPTRLALQHGAHLHSDRIPGSPAEVRVLGGFYQADTLWTERKAERKTRFSGSREAYPLCPEKQTSPKKTPLARIRMIPQGKYVGAPKCWLQGSIACRGVQGKASHEAQLAVTNFQRSLPFGLRRCL